MVEVTGHQREWADLGVLVLQQRVVGLLHVLRLLLAIAHLLQRLQERVLQRMQPTGKQLICSMSAIVLRETLNLPLHLIRTSHFATIDPAPALDLGRLFAQASQQACAQAHGNHVRHTDSRSVSFFQSYLYWKMLP